MAYFSKNTLEYQLNEWLKENRSNWEKRKRESELVLTYPDILPENRYLAERTIEQANFRIEWLNKQIYGFVPTFDDTI
jgi:hypothetical protein